jgi:nucleotide-binding universal stress UspA family protein
MMDKLIVVGVDGSELGDSALRWACGEATRRAAELLLVHATEWPPVDLPTDPRETEEWERAGRLLAGIERQARRLAPGVTVRSELAAEGAAAAVIGRAADADLIVVGDRGRGGFVGLLVGSVSLQVAGHAPCPVALIKAGSLGRDNGPVVVGVGGGRSGAHLAVAFAEAALRGTELQVVNAWSPTPVVVPEAGVIPEAFDPVAVMAEREQDLALLLAPWRERYPEVPVDVALVDDSARHALIGASSQAGLLVVGRHDEGGRHVLALGSVASSVAHHADCPVLLAGPD